MTTDLEALARAYVGKATNPGSHYFCAAEITQLAQGVLDLSAENRLQRGMHAGFLDLLEKRDEEITRLKREVNSMQGDDPNPWRYPEVEEPQ